jgi:hypothetical protein
MKEISVSVRVYDEKFVYTGIEYKIKFAAGPQYLGPLQHPLVKRTFSTGVKAPKIEEIELNVTIEGIPYELGELGSTHAKDGELIYNSVVDGDRMRAMFPLEKAEDSVRMMRALFSNGSVFGGAHKKRMRIMIVKAGTVIDGMPYHDGSAAASPDLCPIKGKPIKLGTTSNNFSIWQHLDWEVIKPDVEGPCHDQLISDLEFFDSKTVVHRAMPEVGSGVVISRLEHIMDDDSFKRRFLDKCGLLVKHPWFSSGAGSRTARLCLSQLFSPYVSARDYLAVAWNCWTAPEGRWIVYRHPAISDGSVRAIHCGPDDKLPTDILWGIVGTLTGFWIGGEWFTAKFGGVVRPLPDGIDMILCDEDIKIGPRMGDITLEADAVLTIIQRFAPSAIMGVPYEEGKLMNLDFDGDLINRVMADKLPNIWGNVKDHMDRSANFKLKLKSNTPWSLREAVRVLLNAMGGSMGWATNLRSWWFSVSERGRLDMIPKIYDDIVELASVMNLDGEMEPTLECVGGVLQYFVQYMIDSQKNMMCDTSVVYGAAAKLQSHFSVVTVKSPGYTSLKRSMMEGVGMVTSFPSFTYELDQDILDKIENDSKYRQQWQYKIHVPPACDGVPAHCFMTNREEIYQIWSRVVVNPNPDAPRIFSTWVPTAAQVDLIAADKLCNLFYLHTMNFSVAKSKGRINLYNPEDVKMFRNQWQDICITFVEKNFGGDMMRACIAFWRVTHDKGDSKVCGAAFLGFPNEAEVVVTQYASSRRAHHCIVVGVKGLMVNLPESLKGTCEILSTGGKHWIIPDEHIAGLNERCFGYLADVDRKESSEGYTWPPEGKYSFKFAIRPSGTAYFAIFEPLQ